MRQMAARRFILGMIRSQRQLLVLQLWEVKRRRFILVISSQTLMIQKQFTWKKRQQELERSFQVRLRISMVHKLLIRQTISQIQVLLYKKQ